MSQQSGIRRVDLSLQIYDPEITLKDSTFLSQLTVRDDTSHRDWRIDRWQIRRYKLFSWNILSRQPRAGLDRYHNPAKPIPIYYRANRAFWHMPLHPTYRLHLQRPYLSWLHYTAQIQILGIIVFQQGIGSLTWVMSMTHAWPPTWWILASIRGISRRRRWGLCNAQGRVFGIDDFQMTSRHGLAWFGRWRYWKMVQFSVLDPWWRMEGGMVSG